MSRNLNCNLFFGALAHRLGIAQLTAKPKEAGDDFEAICGIVYRQRGGPEKIVSWVSQILPELIVTGRTAIAAKVLHKCVSVLDR